MSTSDRRTRLIRHGICRDVLLVGRFAVKVPTFRYGLYSWARGYLANHSECQWGGKVPEGSTVEPVWNVAPVLWSLFGLVNVYPRCEPLSDDADLEQVIAGLGFSPWGDRKRDNLGLLDGRVVWLDYDGSWNGCPHTPWAHDLTDEAVSA